MSFSSFYLVHLSKMLGCAHMHGKLHVLSRSENKWRYHRQCIDVEVCLNTELSSDVFKLKWTSSSQGIRTEPAVTSTLASSSFLRYKKRYMSFLLPLLSRHCTVELSSIFQMCLEATSNPHPNRVGCFFSPLRRAFFILIFIYFYLVSSGIWNDHAIGIPSLFAGCIWYNRDFNLFSAAFMKIGSCKMLEAASQIRDFLPNNECLKWFCFKCNHFAKKNKS